MIETARLPCFDLTTFGVECLTSSYSFELDRATESDWVEHMWKKGWVEMGDFMQALHSARKLVERRNNLLEHDPIKVILCHGSEDKPVVRQLYARLNVEGVRAWIDEDALLPGQDWRMEIERAIRSANAVLVCLSSKSTSKTGFVQKEIAIALDAADHRPEGKIFIIPVKLDDCTVPDRLKNKQWVNLFEPQGIARLLAALRVCASDPA